jgi:hypothetical protein
MPPMKPCALAQSIQQSCKAARHSILCEANLTGLASLARKAGRVRSSTCASTRLSRMPRLSH